MGFCFGVILSPKLPVECDHIVTTLAGDTKVCENMEAAFSGGAYAATLFVQSVRTVAAHIMQGHPKSP